MKNNWYIILLMLISGSFLNAQESLTVSLKEAQQYAIEHAYSSQTKTLDIEKAKKKVWETTAIGLPQVNGSVQFQNFLDIPTQVLPDFVSPAVTATLVNAGILPPSALENQEETFIAAQFGTNYNLTAGGQISQLLFDGSYIVGLQSAKLYVELSESELEKDLITIRKNIYNSYSSVLVSQENLATLQASKQAVETLLNETNALYQSGFAEDTDVDQLRLTLNSLDNQIAFATNQIEVAKNLLKFQMGAPLESTIELTDNLDSFVAQATPELAESKVDVNNLIDFKMIQLQKRSSLMLHKLEQSKALPSVGAFFSHQQQALGNEFNFFSSDGTWYPSTVWGLSVSIPILSGGGRYFKMQQTKIEIEKSAILEQQVEQSLQLAAISSKANYVNALKVLENAKTNMQLAKKIQERFAIKFKEGLASSIELTQAQNQFLSAQGNYILAMYDLIQSKAELDQSLGNFNQ